MLSSARLDDCGDVIRQAVNERYREIFDFYYGLMNSDSDFEEYYRKFFPSGYIDRNPEKAKQIIRDLDAILSSPVVREKLAGIYIYVMRSMIEDWYVIGRDMEMILLPEEVEEYISNADEEEIDSIILWFTDVNECMDDFEETYHAVLLQEDIAEMIAVRALREPHELEQAEMAGISLSDLLDLLPNDLYDQVVQMKESEDSIAHRVLVALEKLCNRAWDYRDFSENGLNRQVRDFLDDGSYAVMDQAQQGISENGKDEGSLDILIKDRGLNTAVYEGLIHKNKKYLMSHINKARGRYNPSGCRSVFVCEYFRVKNFEAAWKNSIRSLQGMEVDTGRNGIRLFRMKDVWLFGVNMFITSD